MVHMPVMSLACAIDVPLMSIAVRRLFGFVAVHSPGTFKCSVFHNCKEDGLVEVILASM